MYTQIYMYMYSYIIIMLYVCTTYHSFNFCSRKLIISPNWFILVQSWPPYHNPASLSSLSVFFDAPDCHFQRQQAKLNIKHSIELNIRGIFCQQFRFFNCWWLSCQESRWFIVGCIFRQPYCLHVCMYACLYVCLFVCLYLARSIHMSMYLCI